MLIKGKQRGGHYHRPPFRARVHFLRCLSRGAYSRTLVHKGTKARGSRLWRHQFAITRFSVCILAHRTAGDIREELHALCFGYTNEFETKPVQRAKRRRMHDYVHPVRWDHCTRFTQLLFVLLPRAVLRVAPLSPTMYFSLTELLNYIVNRCN